MPRTLTLSILRELVRLLVLTSAVLVLVISFAAAIKPMSDGLLSPLTLVKFVVLTVPTVLGIALPFAGAFAGTLVYSRLANDNEVLACSASGLSYRVVFGPAFTLGLVLMLVLAYLSSAVVPLFVRQVAELVRGDVVTVLVTRLNQNQPYIFREHQLVIYADSATVLDQEPRTLGSGFVLEKEVQLRGVAVAKVGPQKEVRNDATAQEAQLQLFRDPEVGRAYVRMRLIDPLIFNEASGELDRQEAGRTGSMNIKPIPLPNLVKDNPQFMTFSELRELEQEPHRFDAVRDQMEALAHALAEERLRQKVFEKWEQGEPVELLGPIRGELYRVRVGEVQRLGSTLWLLPGDAAQGSPGVVVDRIDTDSPSHTVSRRFIAQRGELEVLPDELATEPVIRLRLHKVKIADPGTRGMSNEASLRELSPLSWPEGLLPVQEGEVSTVPLRDESARSTYENSARVQELREGLALILKRLGANVTSRHNERLASSVSCMLLVMLGAVLSVRFRGYTALVVYFFSFLMALVSILVIKTGQNLATLRGDHSLAIGMTVMWSSNLLLLAVVLWNYRKVGRH